SEGLDLVGTQAESYLRIGRGIPLTTWPASLRYLPARGSYPPALMARVLTPEGVPSAVHLVRLATDGSPAKHSQAPVKVTIGACRGAAVHLGEPASGTLAVCEGIEDGLTAMAAKPGLAVWAALGGNLRAIEIPQTVREVKILADADRAGQETTLALATRLLTQGFEVRVVRPPAGAKDLNEALLGGKERP
ncbi:MAG: toprim domain-containing protein, partial [Cyanobacteria bacterium REEB65]|nr:toprim domain-containing protein [Cyanobacteria bacterium REEB65]